MSLWGSERELKKGRSCLEGRVRQTCLVYLTNDIIVISREEETCESQQPHPILSNSCTCYWELNIGGNFEEQSRYMTKNLWVHQLKTCTSTSTHGSFSNHSSWQDRPRPAAHGDPAHHSTLYRERNSRAKNWNFHSTEHASEMTSKPYQACWESEHFHDKFSDVKESAKIHTAASAEDMFI